MFLGGVPGIIIDKMLANSMGSRRKSEAANYVDNDHTPYLHKSGKRRKEEIKEDLQGPIFESQALIQKKNGRSEMCILPMCSQKRASGDWISEIDFRSRKFGPWPLSDIFGKMVYISEKSSKPWIEMHGD